ncbi:signal peptidase II [Actibacterium lipolyticum]|uniref:Lipoprotein signal peptidase n=1 Tax=Actibacterium lipolyticum TaxID=1524263 RepID=A0A238KUH2_9RHOB|nr:signal peptidase II [Actibacterium lipolyticum]SMX46241.1 Lipoprotein signal peptidase [Actibacterium lipolyticum]
MRLMAITALVVFLLDQATKYYVVFYLNLQERLAIDVLPPFLNFRMAWNQGVNFGLFANDASTMRWVLVGLAVAISVWLAIWGMRGQHKPIVLFSIGVLIGGAIGNAVDRVLLGAVADFLNMSCCGFRNPFSFNVADIAIFAGAIGVVIFAGEKKTT